jgi:hypothetical protein
METTEISKITEGKDGKEKGVEESSSLLSP